MATILEIGNMSLDERLTGLIEECAELIQAATKWKRFGQAVFFDGTKYDNFNDLLQEFNQVTNYVRAIQRHVGEEFYNKPLEDLSDPPR